MQVFETAFEFVGCENNKLIASAFSAFDNPILLLHGGGQTRHSWQKSAKQFAELHGLAITIDGRGHGDSQWVSSKAYRFNDYTKDLVVLAQQIIEKTGEKPIAIGASLGGISALNAQYQENQSLLSALVLVDITPRVNFSGVAKILGFMAERVEEGFATIDEAADAIAAYLPDRKRAKNLKGLEKNLRKCDDGRWRWHWDPAFLDARSRSMDDRDDWIEDGLEAVKALTIPTLLVRGAKSELIEKAHVEEFLELAPHAKYIDVNDAGHMVAGDKNDVFFEGIKGFLLEEGLI